MIPIRLYLYAAIALALAGLLWHDHAMTRQRNAAIARANAAEGQVRTLEHAAAIDSKFAAQLATFAQQQHIDFKAFDAKLKGSTITHEVRYETKSGEQVVCHERDRAVYRRLHNEAVRGAADPAVVP